ncbi:hypothetical protein SEA_ANNADREAMY_188 [Streptomyces phage Annadreamy]|uniref:Uncharacterized protein n=2 Tax=Annadreamyvirus annadreamy TaxID=2846392 RepID=A0A345GTK1_9CAUD|nr:hypothetical protein HWB75_gp090 [Streptomyces phage Annadreamy]AXG66273.1 hypothetical protein SEA_ANNADREAMY_188 [Streptomyces phage Annadreamy]QGH79496.1 hypothetical protein SEA_LIMPID_195 [Streptomyces phage Limpid]
MIEEWENEGGFVYTTKYYLNETDDDDNWVEVTKEEFVRAERAAGFHNTMGRPDEPATGGFSSSSYRKRGRVRYITKDDE